MTSPAAQRTATANPSIVNSIASTVNAASFALRYKHGVPPEADLQRRPPRAIAARIALPLRLHLSRRISSQLPLQRA